MRGPARPWCLPPWPVPPPYVLLQNGFLRAPCTYGYPVRSFIGFKPNQAGANMPRIPWPFESETRKAGTGLALGCMPYRQIMPAVHG